MTRPEIVAIVWAPHEARTASFADWLGAELHNVHFLLERRPWLAPIKYVPQWIATWWLLLRKRPRFVYVTNSPPFAGLCVMLFCSISRTKFVMDTHPPGLFSRRWAWSKPLQRFTARYAHMNVIDQERFARMFREWGAPVMVLENPPKLNLPARPALGLPTQPTISYIGTFGQDEPVDALMEAARLLPDVKFYVLGNIGLARQSVIATAPPNVEFTGYLLRDEYWNRLYRSHAIVALTTHEHSLSGAAQDGLTIGAPLVLSDQPTLREYFTQGAVFAPNNGRGLATGIQSVLEDNERLRSEMFGLRDVVSMRWRENFEALKRIMSDPKSS